MRYGRKLAGFVAGAGLVIGSLVATSVPAQAYGSELNILTYTRDTDYCPCKILDPEDNTYFEYDAGGLAVKADFDIERSPWPDDYAGKVEFHPSGEKIWLYDTYADGDTIYVRYSYTIPGGETVRSGIHAPKNGAGPTIDANITEGWAVRVEVFDNASGTDRIGTWTGIA